MRARLIALLLALLALASCNTVAGVGKDIGAAGGVVTGVARKVQQQL